MAFFFEGFPCLLRAWLACEKKKDTSTLRRVFLSRLSRRPACFGVFGFRAERCQLVALPEN